MRITRASCLVSKSASGPSQLLSDRVGVQCERQCCETGTSKYSQTGQRS